jgi:hypothetical protein
VGVIDQALLGYDRGHRLLASSLKLPREAEAALVALSDTDVRHGRRLTGMPMASFDRYALIATWPAPDAGRPGAVWAHALLIDTNAFHEFRVSDLVALLQPPRHGASSSSYSEPLPVRRAQRRPPHPPEHDVYLCARALYASKVPHAHVKDPQAGEDAVVALWSAQWPALQARFSFALRSASYRSRRPHDLLVLTGEGSPPPRPHGDDHWLMTLAGELADRPGDLTAWLARFGPQEPSRTASVRALARIWSTVHEERVPQLLDALAERYPSPEDHAEMKLAILGRSRDWWAVSQSARLTGLLGSAAHAWDLTQLEFERRLTEECRAGRWPALINALSPDAPGETRDALLSALTTAADPAMLGVLAARDVQLAGDLLAQARVGDDPEAWRDLDGETVTTLLHSSRAGLRPRELAAALSAGHLSAVLAAAGVRATLKACARVDAKTLAAIARSTVAPDLLRGADPKEILTLASAGADVSAAGRATALEALRAHPDARWLKLAVVTLIEDPASLDVVFGPVHAAAVEGRLTQASTKRLEKMLPPGAGVPQRLRALLLKRARKERWSRAHLARAVRDAGPDASLLLKELEPKDPLQKGIKWILLKAHIHL